MRDGGREDEEAKPRAAASENWKDHRPLLIDVIFQLLRSYSRNVMQALTLQSINIFDRMQKE